ncbi:hypothetical protein SK128_022932 [Halocaridina rubra]|uniref:Uncharacterized protein n=1 Tax=Halocaridina rubra TaxID=373956 RepID=A0AAN8XM54_HALRR
MKVRSAKACWSLIWNKPFLFVSRSLYPSLIHSRVRKSLLEPDLEYAIPLCLNKFLFLFDQIQGQQKPAGASSGISHSSLSQQVSIPL